MSSQYSSGECSEAGDSDGRRDTQRYSSVEAALVGISQALDMANGQVHLAEPGKPCNLFATLTGSGGAAA